ncbi:hypothetical protein [Pseudomonas reidholzensis]|uniref:hypothetical protein n=1 Tax=Pseudomonas reidholzensis TaxID=1785162 RepID=UPI0011C46E97|nr:hypothetical protein [Pseudomonas reidholzensis]
MNDFFQTITTTETTATHNLKELDMLARVTKNTFSQIVEIQTIRTQDFLGQLNEVRARWQNDLRTLNNVINWQHRVLDFNSSYTAYLLEQISEEEFEKAAEAIAVEEMEHPINSLAVLIKKTLELTEIEFSPSDLANLLHCSVESVDKALSLIPRNLIFSQPQLQEAAK